MPKDIQLARRIRGRPTTSFLLFWQCLPSVPDVVKQYFLPKNKATMGKIFTVFV